MLRRENWRSTLRVGWGQRVHQPASTSKPWEEGNTRPSSTVICLYLLIDTIDLGIIINTYTEWQIILLLMNISLERRCAIIHYRNKLYHQAEQVLVHLPPAEFVDTKNVIST